MGHDENDSFKLTFRNVRARKEFPQKRLAFRFLKISSSASVFLPAERTRYIVYDGACLKKVLFLLLSCFVSVRRTAFLTPAEKFTHPNT